MKSVRRLCGAFILTLALNFSAFAGDVQFPGVTSPPPDQQTSAPGDIQLPSATGEIQTPGATSAGQMDTPLTSDAGTVAEWALTLMANVLSVF
ncbi:MAG TPA: hypothetical protein VJS44_15435 [Pyrinomonadaceae bacterium]|nr:hypothetical protein [Pyrinomonadaceae bacterium]